MTYQQFIESTGLRMTCIRAYENPSNKAWKDADHWKCLLTSTKTKGRMTVFFSQGYGHNGKEPTLEGVLNCLGSDSAGIENNPTFEDWCSEYGYSEDSRQAEATFKACEKQAERLRRFLGDSAMDRLLWECREDG